MNTDLKSYKNTKEHLQNITKVLMLKFKLKDLTGREESRFLHFHCFRLFNIIIFMGSIQVA